MTISHPVTASRIGECKTPSFCERCIPSPRADRSSTAMANGSNIGLARCALGIETQLQHRPQAGHPDDYSEAGPVVTRVVEFRHVFGAERPFVEPERLVEVRHRELEVVNAA